MPVSVTVTHIKDGVSDNKRFVDVSLALSGAYNAAQAADGVPVDIKTLPLDEVSEVLALPFSGSGGAAAVQLGGTKSAPTIKLRVFDPTDGSAYDPVDTDTPPASIRVRLLGA